MMHVEVVVLPRGIDKARAKLSGSDHHCTTENDVTQTKERETRWRHTLSNR